MADEAKPRPAPVALPRPLVLAAMQRAQLHSGAGRFLKREVIEHLGLRRTATTTRRLRPPIKALREEGLIVQVSGHGASYWRLTEAGEARLAVMRRAGKVGELPGSPQHRRWRNARRLAGERIEEIREEAVDALEEAERLLTAAPGPGSAAISELRGRFWRCLERLALATYCLEEWPEPDEARRDLNQNLDWRTLADRGAPGEAKTMDRRK
jgi:DNA-binding PadR family transcriptional regulator